MGRGRHRHASRRLGTLYRIKDHAFAFVGERLAAGAPVTELEVQAAMQAWFVAEGLVTDAPPIVAASAAPGDPHYARTATTSRLIQPGDLVLLDLWGKLEQRGPFMPISPGQGSWAANHRRWSGSSASSPQPAMRRWKRCRRALVPGRTFADGRSIARPATSSPRPGYGERFMHRTGHSLGRTFMATACTWTTMKRTTTGAC